jgi:hypothetical protein
MKPGSRDIKLQVLISGEALTELQRHSWQMATTASSFDSLRPQIIVRELGLGFATLVARSMTYKCRVFV